MDYFVWGLVEHITNNAAEAGNIHLQLRVKSNHPSVYRLLVVLKDELDNSMLKCSQALE